jgi:hypothetical protein
LVEALRGLGGHLQTLYAQTLPAGREGIEMQEEIERLMKQADELERSHCAPSSVFPDIEAPALDGQAEESSEAK